MPPAGTPGKRHQQSHSRAQRQEFLSAVARLGSVAAAAKELGINRSTCQKWANAAGIRRMRLSARTDKDQFHAVLDRTSTIAAAARDLGLNNSTANKLGRSDQYGSQEAAKHPVGEDRAAATLRTGGN